VPPYAVPSVNARGLPSSIITERGPPLFLVPPPFFQLSPPIEGLDSEDFYPPCRRIPLTLSPPPNLSRIFFFFVHPASKYVSCCVGPCPLTYTPTLFFHKPCPFLGMRRTSFFRAPSSLLAPSLVFCVVVPNGPSSLPQPSVVDVALFLVNPR